MKLVKIILISLLVLAGLFLIAQIWMAFSSSNIEQYKYEVLKEYEDFEIRKYEPSNFIYVTMNAQSYSETSTRGFRTLAGYIFGNNEREEKIAMTSPVAMDIGDSTTMMFMVPSKYELEELPEPGNKSVQFRQEPEKIMAAIRFGGWMSDAKMKKYSQRLEALLDEKGIRQKGHFMYLGYNPPYELFNRRNEVIVEVEWPKDEDSADL